MQTRLQPPIKVLCVDDDDLIAQIIRITLNNAGGFIWQGQVREAGQLLERARDDRPDVVLVDLSMPGECPLAVMRQLGREHPTVRVLVFSGCVSQRLIDRAIDAGAFGFLSKDHDGAEIVDAIRRVARGEFISQMSASCACP